MKNNFSMDIVSLVKNNLFNLKKGNMDFIKKIILILLVLLTPVIAFAQTNDNGSSAKVVKLKGFIQDSKGDPIIGASISVNGKGGTVTDLNGLFQLNCPEGSNIAISFIGYQKKEIKITNQSFLKVTLYESTEALKDIVVVGYGTQKKATLVGSVQSVNTSELRVPSANLTTAFAGKLAGVIATQTSGEPGSDGASFWIRGQSTFGSSTTPLVIIDGVEGATGDLNALDTDVIESLSILKDATATALYGTRGANGVVIVTTKNGQDREKPAINIRVEGYMNQPIKVPKLVDGATYMELYNEANDSRQSGGVDYTQTQIDNTRKKTNMYEYPDVNWYKQLFNNTSYNQDVDMSVRGGSQRADYFMNVSVHNQNGMLKNLGKKYGYSWNTNENVKRYVFQNNLGVNITPTTRASLKLHVELDPSDTPSSSTSTLFNDAMAISPVEFPIYFPSSSLVSTSTWKNANQRLWGGRWYSTTNEANPVAVGATGYSKTFSSTLLADFQIDQDLKFITKGLKATLLASFKNWSYTYTNHYVGYNQFSSSSYDDSTGLLDVSMVGSEKSQSLSYSSSSNGDRTYYFEGLLNYERTFGDNDVSLMAVYNQREYNYNEPSSDDNSLPFRTQGVAGRANYVYKGRYLSEFNFGYDGSENFAKGHRWGFFPSIGLGYIVSEEPWWKSSKIGNVITNLKVRGSWGEVGNADSSTRFMYLSSISLNKKGYTTGMTGNYSFSGPSYNRFGNEDITWETAYKTNLGLDLQLFKRVNITADVFKERRRNIFMQNEDIEAELGTGGTATYGNWGKVDNKGLDASINYNTNLGKDFIIQVNGTFTYAKNTVKAYPEAPYTTYPQLSLVGHSLNSVLGYVADGLFKDANDVSSSPTQTISGITMLPGDIKYKNLPNKDGTTDNEIDSNDRKYIGHPTVPEIVYGFGTNMKYKNCDLSLFFQGQGIVSLFMSGFHPFGTIINDNYNVLKWVASNRWTTANQNVNAKYPRLSEAVNTNTTATSTYWMRDASFLKLKAVEIGYTYKKFLRFYISGMNLLTFSKFKLWDPAMGGGSGFAYPTQRTINIGLQMSFNK